MQIGKRLFYNKITGRILNGSSAERFDSGLTEQIMNELRPSIENIGTLDLSYGDKTLENVLEFHIENGQIVIDKRIEPQLTPEEEKIKELENQLLLSQEGLL